MVDSPDNDCPLVKLAVAILDDEHGITDPVAWEALNEMCKAYYGTRPLPLLLEKVFRSTDGCDGRVYLPDGWNDSVIPEITLPVIGTLKADGQVEFNKE